MAERWSCSRTSTAERLVKRASAARSPSRVAPSGGLVTQAAPLCPSALTRAARRLHRIGCSSFAEPISPTYASFVGALNDIIRRAPTAWMSWRGWHASPRLANACCVIVGQPSEHPRVCDLPRHGASASLTAASFCGSRHRDCAAVGRASPRLDAELLLGFVAAGRARRCWRTRSARSRPTPRQQFEESGPASRARGADGVSAGRARVLRAHVSHRRAGAHSAARDGAARGARHGGRGSLACGWRRARGGRARHGRWRRSPSRWRWSGKSRGLATDVSAEALALAPRERRHVLGAHQGASTSQYATCSTASTVRCTSCWRTCRTCRRGRVLPSDVKDYEPNVAIFGGPRGTELIETLLATGASRAGTGRRGVRRAGRRGAGAARGRACAQGCTGADVSVRQDAGGYDRVGARRR